MKKNLLILTFVILFFSSCAFHNGLTSNSNLHNTEVLLAKNNFKVISRVKGESEATYIFGIGGLSKSALIAEAKEDMLSNADIIGGSKAIINETVEIKNAFYLIFWVNKVTVSANIIEFIDPNINIIAAEKNNNINSKFENKIDANNINVTNIETTKKSPEIKSESVINENSSPNPFKVGDNVEFATKQLIDGVRISMQIHDAKVDSILGDNLFITYTLNGKKIKVKKHYLDVVKE